MNRSHRDAAVSSALGAACTRSARRDASPWAAAARSASAAWTSSFRTAAAGRSATGLRPHGRDPRPRQRGALCDCCCGVQRALARRTWTAVVQPGPVPRCWSSAPSTGRSAATSGGWWRAPAYLRDGSRIARRRNTRGRSRRNIAAHYDLGNDFYRLFLDETMTYSSAVFASPDQSLADAQRNKYRIIAERAGLTGGEHVLEIGSGWGGFALYAAGELGCRVTTITISQAQYDLAAERIRATGLDHLVDGPAPGLPGRHRLVRRHRVHRDAGGGRRGVSTRPSSRRATGR